MALSILSMGTCHPNIVIDNQFLEDLDTGTTVAWIEEKIGIKTRLTTLPLDYIKTTRNPDSWEARAVATMSPTEMGTRAALKALEKARLKPSDIGLVICNCCTPYQTQPSESFRIAQALDILPLTYDVYSACPAFALHVDYLNRFKPEMLPEFILCVTTSTYTHHVNYNDRTDGAIWGDGAAAWIMSMKHPGKLKVIETNFQADPTRCGAVVVDRKGHFYQDGRAVRDFSVRQTVRMIKSIEETHPIDWTRDLFVGHQANRTMLEQIVTNREIPPDNHLHNVTYYGNQGGAGAPASISQNWERLQPGQHLIAAVLGAGLSWGSVLFKVS